MSSRWNPVLAEGRAFVPFFMLGYPTLDASRRLVDAAVRGGARGLELGLPFSDPIADGPVIQTTAVHALRQGFRLDAGFEALAAIRRDHPTLPIGLLVYANLVRARGLPRFYAAVAGAGVDAVLVADVPVREVQPFVRAALDADVDPVCICPPNASDETVRRVAKVSRSFVYCVCRAGTTGATAEGRVPPASVLSGLERHGGPPAIAGFGLSTPAHVRAAYAAGAAGAIVGSALSRLIIESEAAAEPEVERFVRACSEPGDEG
jgi:tryptophan synthase alpha chain